MNGFKLVSCTNTLSHAVFFPYCLGWSFERNCPLISANERHIDNYLYFLRVICPFFNCGMDNLLDMKIPFQ